MEEESVSEWDYQVFCQAVRNSKGSIHSSADNADDVDVEAGTLITSGDSFKEKITRKLQPSVKAALRHSARIAQGVKTSDDLVVTPLCNLPFAQKSKLKFFSPHNVLGREHYRLRMDETAEYLPRPRFLGSVTAARPKVYQYTVSAQTLLHTE